VGDQPFTSQQYSQQLDQILTAGLGLFPINVRGKTVVLKPNLVDYIPGNAINTHPVLVLAAAESFRHRGAKSVVVAEGPGYQRDTRLVLSQSGYEQCLRDEKIRFIDLNRDELIRTQLRAAYTGMKCLWIPRTVLETDFVGSMPKIKTHHWSGVTLSMKNMFGVLPGARYGWPKNILHWKGIQESILDLCATVPVHFVIADGIVAMEGNGPLNGTIRPLGRIVLADDPVAADATCARLMGFKPRRIVHIREGSRFPGNSVLSTSSRLEKPLMRPQLPSRWFQSFKIFVWRDGTFSGSEDTDRPALSWSQRSSSRQAPYCERSVDSCLGLFSCFGSGCVCGPPADSSHRSECGRSF